MKPTEEAAEKELRVLDDDDRGDLGGKGGGSGACRVSWFPKGRLSVQVRAFGSGRAAVKFGDCAEYPGGGELVVFLGSLEEVVATARAMAGEVEREAARVQEEARVAEERSQGGPPVVAS